jgi:predicted permease
MLALLGFAIYENTVGYYMMARSGTGTRDALRRVVKLPAIQAVALGLAAN